MKKKIIRNYKIIDEINDSAEKHLVVPKIIKKSTISPVAKDINFSKTIQDPKLPQKQEQSFHKDPEIEVLRDKNEIILGINVFCGCGEKITIKFDYK